MPDFIEQSSAKDRIPELERLFKLRPNSTILAELGAHYFTANRPQEAYLCLKKAWDKNHTSQIAMNLALTLKDLGRHDEAFHYVEIGHFLDPDNQYIRLGYAEAILKAGHWHRAWPIYDNARPTQAGVAMDLHLPSSVKEWMGGSLPEGHLLLVASEGGNGDRLNYARWLPELTRRGINWRFYPYEALFSLFERVLPKELLVRDGADIPNPTHWCTTFSLPAKLDVGPNEIPPPLPFTALPELKQKYEVKSPDGRPVVGICYQAAELFQGGRTVRSLSEGQALRLVCSTLDKICWVSLQYQTRVPFPVTNPIFNTWEDTVALIDNMSAVVSVDTAVFHISGAMGKQTAGILGGNACWKFFRSGTKDRWYPSAKLYRNEGYGFENAIDKLIIDIRNGIWPKIPQKI